jgi:hypothetical protein
MSVFFFGFTQDLIGVYGIFEMSLVCLSIVVRLPCLCYHGATYPLIFVFGVGNWSFQELDLLDKFLQEEATAVDDFANSSFIDPNQTSQVVPTLSGLY